ncbi:MAG: Eco57I restriction-modification methylase domain-containing protein [Candidatus Hermodarchaeota archaeon]
MISILDNIINEFENKRSIDKKNNRDRGVIYTPQPIVNFMIINIFKNYFDEFPEIQKILQNNCYYKSLKQLFIKNKRLKENFESKIRNIRILDPACGTGRFLIAIASVLFDFYKLFEFGSSDSEIKKVIIQNNIIGIEIDKLSCIISKLRLTKWLYNNNLDLLSEFNPDNPILGEIESVINNLPLNFKIFNLDYLLDYEAKDIDIIIGNPPYVENKKILEKEFKKNLKQKFESAYKLFDLCVVFIEKSLKLLKKNVGCLSFIITNKFLSADYGVKIRGILLQKTEIKEIMNISSLPIFKNTAAYPIILILKKVDYGANLISIKKYDSIKDIKKNIYKSITKFPQKLIYNFPSQVIPLSEKIELIEQIYSKYSILSESFKDLKIIYRPFGFINWSKNSKNIKQNATSTKDLILLSTGNIGRYFIDFNKKIKIGKDRYQHPYYHYTEDYMEIWKELSSEKLIFREIAKNLAFVYDPGVFTNLTGLYFLRVPSLTTDQLFSLLAILNSNLVNQIFKSLYGTLHMSGGYLRVNGSFIKNLPIPYYLPGSLSHISKILQFLTQLRYEILQKPVLPLYSKLKLDRIENYIAFYDSFSNSLINQLYSDAINFKVDIDEKNLPKIKFKFVTSYYSSPRVETYSDEEIIQNIKKIRKFYELEN